MDAAPQPGGLRRHRRAAWRRANASCIRAATGDEIAGTVAWHNPGRDLFVTVDDLNDGVFRLSTWRAGGQTGLQVWMTTYDARHAARVREFGARAQQLIDRLFQ